MAMIHQLSFIFFLLYTQIPEPWAQVRHHNGVKVWARQHKQSAVKEIRAEVTLDANMEDVWQVIIDLEHYPEFMPYVKESILIEEDETCRYEYLRIHPPLVQQRDYTLCVQSKRDEEEGLYVREWQAVSHKGPEARADSVRLKICNGSFTLKKLDEQSTHLTYWVHTDPEGMIPGALVNLANRQSIPEVLDAIRQRVAKFRSDKQASVSNAPDLK